MIAVSLAFSPLLLVRTAPRIVWLVGALLWNSRWSLREEQRSHPGLQLPLAFKGAQRSYCQRRFFLTFNDYLPSCRLSKLNVQSENRLVKWLIKAGKVHYKSKPHGFGVIIIKLLLNAVNFWSGQTEVEEWSHLQRTYKELSFLSTSDARTFSLLIKQPLDTKVLWVVKLCQSQSVHWIAVLLSEHGKEGFL